MADQPNIGFIGIGNMGALMARNLIGAGFSVTVMDAVDGRAQEFAEIFGCEFANELAGLGNSDAIITMLPTGADVKSALLGDGGLAAHLAIGSIIADMSSSEPVATVELGAALAEKGLTLIDAPVSGGTSGADAASLTIMIGGDDEAAIDRMTPAFEVMGKNLFRTGKLGSGHAVKALNNFIAAANFAAASEALIVGQKFGLDADTILDVVNVSSGRNSATEGAMKNHVLSGKFGAGFSLGLMAKDVRIARGLSQAMTGGMAQSKTTESLWDEAESLLGGDADFTAAYKAWDK